LCQEERMKQPVTVSHGTTGSRADGLNISGVEIGLSGFFKRIPDK